MSPNLPASVSSKCVLSSIEASQTRMLMPGNVHMFYTQAHRACWALFNLLEPAGTQALGGAAGRRTTCNPISTWLPSFCQLATLPPMKGRDSYTSTS